MSKGNASGQILPQLDNCNMIANHWAKELLTIFDDTCVKEWEQNQHLKVRSKDPSFRIALRIHKRNILSYYPLIISSSNDILSKGAKTYPPDTLILIGSSTTDKCTLVWWDEKDNAELFFTLDKNNGHMNRFILTNDKGSYSWDYLQFKNTSNNLIDNAGRLHRFLNENLSYQALNKTRSKGGRISNQNSEVQSARKQGKPITGSTVILEWPNRIEYKTMLDAYKTVSAEYEYTKSYRTFVRELKKSGENPIKFTNLEVSLETP